MFSKQRKASIFTTVFDPDPEGQADVQSISASELDARAPEDDGRERYDVESVSSEKDSVADKLDEAKSEAISLSKSRSGSVT